MKKLRVAQIGMYHEHAPGKFDALRKMPDEVEILGVVDEHDFCQVPKFSDWISPCYDGYPRLTLDEVFAMKNELDFVVVEVPNLELVRIGMMCAQQGIPIHLDKPAGLDLEEYRKLLECCRKNNVPLQMGYMLRTNPALSYARQLVKDGVLGDIYSITMDMNHGYGGDPYNEYLRLFPGGIMFNLGCHLIDYIISVMGEPECVTPFLKATADVDQATVNNTMAVFSYPNALAHISICSKRLAGCTTERCVVIEGTNGRIRIQPMETFAPNSLRMSLKVHEARGSFPAGTDTTVTFPPLNDRYIAQLRELGEIVRSGKTPEYSYDHDYSVHKITLKAAGII
ncbi:MAG: Gfo/Idh/MocA family oxidoreductase [Victivallales bacterium]|nr:Gfo/Idh/MocA family oxidoreductase [Victivallales bacterium]